MSTQCSLNTQGKYTVAEKGKVVYNIHRYGMESHCVGAVIACAGHGERQLPMAAVLSCFSQNLFVRHLILGAFLYYKVISLNCQ